MTVRRSADGGIELNGVCGSEEAETLLQFLLTSSGAQIDWRTCTHAHSAIIQILLAVRPALLGPPASDFLRIHVAPALNGRE